MHTTLTNAEFPLFWIPLLPLIGAVFCLLVGRHMSRKVVHVVACGVVLLAFMVTARAVFQHLMPLWQAAHEAGAAAGVPKLTYDAFEWISAGELTISMGLLCDPLTAVMLLVVTFVGFLIHLYSTGYMDHEASYARYFGYLNLFTSAMLLLVLGDNLAVLFVGWEGVGVCSYLLIGFWYDKDGTSKPGVANAVAGKKAFIANRVGDLAFLLGMFVLFAATKTLNIEQLGSRIDELTHVWQPFGLLTVSVAGAAAVLLLIGATGKSAQIPLYIWLPDAMAGPTPVSALIHAATMVTAGVYMITRLNFIYLLSPVAMGMVALVGGVTALFAATIGLAQNDIKKVLAYSTISQLGYMFLAVGVGAFSAGVFHLFTHAFFKACLFLGAGAVIHALHGEQDIRQMGGLRKHLPVVHWTFLFSTLAIAGIFPWAGFFSKDEILWKTLSSANSAWPPWLSGLLFVLGMASALCTSFYMFRLYFLTFGAKFRGDHHALSHLHHPGLNMTVPLQVLALLATVIGFLGMPELGPLKNWFHHWLGPVLEHGSQVAAATGFLEKQKLTAVGPNHLAENHAIEVGLMVASLLVAAVGIFAAKALYGAGDLNKSARLTSGIKGAVRLVANKYWIDELVGWLVLKPVRLVSVGLYRVVDRFFIDWMGVSGSAWIVDSVGRMTRRFHNGNLQRYVMVMLVGIALVLWKISTPPAEVSIEPQSAVKSGQPVVLRARSKQSGTAEQRQLQYRWDFDGDGTWDTSFLPAAIATHRYAKAGEYRATLQVRDLRWQTHKTYTTDVLVQ